MSKHLMKAVQGGSGGFQKHVKILVSAFNTQYSKLKSTLSSGYD